MGFIPGLTPMAPMVRSGDGDGGLLLTATAPATAIICGCSSIFLPLQLKSQVDMLIISLVCAVRISGSSSVTGRHPTSMGMHGHGGPVLSSGDASTSISHGGLVGWYSLLLLSDTGGCGSLGEVNSILL
jgi:hypothetical protein